LSTQTASDISIQDSLLLGFKLSKHDNRSRFAVGGFDVWSYNNEQSFETARSDFFFAVLRLSRSEEPLNSSGSTVFFGVKGRDGVLSDSTTWNKFQ
jgi:hypothetical protein